MRSQGRNLWKSDNSLRREPFFILHYMVRFQNWEPLAEVNWMHHATDLFMGVIDADQPALLPGRLPLPTGCTTFSKQEQADISRFLVTLLSKEFLIKPVDRRSNVVQILLGDVRACTPTPILPPHLVRYLANTYSAWLIAIEHLQEMSEELVDDEVTQEIVSDVLAQLYTELGETDIFMVQIGEWTLAEQAVSNCYYIKPSVPCTIAHIGYILESLMFHLNTSIQDRARSDLITLGKDESSLWEDHWVLCVKKMQQWDFLSELARAEHNSKLLLECQWRRPDWDTEHANVKLALNSSPGQSIRKNTLQAYLTLMKNHTGVTLDEGKALQTTTSQNLDSRSADLKHVINTWRENQSFIGQIIGKFSKDALTSRLSTVYQLVPDVANTPVFPCFQRYKEDNNNHFVKILRFSTRYGAQKHKDLIVVFKISDKEHCTEAGFAKDDPIVAYVERMRSLAYDRVDAGCPMHFQEELEHRLSIFVRDEIVAWNTMRQIKLAPDDPRLMITVKQNLQSVIKRAHVLSCEMERMTIDPHNPQPVCQNVTELINTATNLPKLYSMHPSWMPWL
ncbi:uncharacterized protein MELLADRAFT_112932 [Melampsora larici-populina 98AG31]|uniref:FATC domain-containing protein n=1 Tax=Melampsora larici-populina (strain 98AG31 / pathotype 3-4-7) TaxID=747676 RepID=F4S857_MELLP|nr:uncharacterized protein MELLADRAFT_112932 [Melampsora larici-populina 98AG31]EGF99177.1 hypothetical protein MELLADRAFT_112932 [Melampsora larici-populina 98AG31]